MDSLNKRIKFLGEVVASNNLKDIQTIHSRAEEIGHNKLTVGDITDQSEISNRKQEYKARKYSLELVISLNDIIDAYSSGCSSYFSVAEYLEINEMFLREAIEIYRKQYGTCVKLDNYIIYFEPTLSILEIF